MTNPQIIAKVMTRLMELGLSDDKVMSATLSIVPAIVEVGEDHIETACQLFADKMR